ncbi:MAG: 50S ribosomal protein L11 methyltransferase, partial [Desulfovibrio sp.]|nr:50S ribosomal protein L11 methyltransferase [Desulfovibrio sp.]
EDWLCTWKEHFQPVLCGEHFVVLPPWSIEAWAKENQDSQRFPIIIEPKNAFGTGQHASTALCLSFLSDEAVHLREKMRQSKLNFLDLGTGSGILAIAASKLGLSGQALDIDSDAVANAKENFKANGLNSTVQVALGSIDKVAGQHFQLIFANILAAPLIAMASPLAQALEKHGRLILSGLLNEQNDQVSAAFVACGLKKIEERSQGEWCALLFEA